MLEVLTHKCHRGDKRVGLNLVEVHYVLLDLLDIVSKTVLDAGRIRVSGYNCQLLDLFDRQALQRSAVAGFN